MSIITITEIEDARIAGLEAQLVSLTEIVKNTRSSPSTVGITEQLFAKDCIKQPPQTPRYLQGSRSPRSLTPIVVSPTESLVSDGHDGEGADNPFDTPYEDRTSRGRKKASESTASPPTPLTPLLVESNDSMEPESPTLRKGVQRSKVHRQDILEGYQSVGIEGDEDFKPQKLIKNMTFEMERISQALKASGSLKLSVDIDFSPSPSYKLVPTTLSQSATTRSKTSSDIAAAVSVIAVESQEIAGNLKHVASDQAVSGLYALKQPLTDFGRGLEHIVPYTICSRLEDNASGCVSSLVGDTRRRCSSNRKEQGNAWRKDIKAISKCCKGRIDEGALVSLVHKLIGDTMCGTHQTSSRSPKRLGKLGQWAGAAARVREEQEDFDVWIRCITGKERLSSSEVDPQPKCRIRQRSCDTVKSPKSHIDIPKSTSTYFQPYQSARLRNVSVEQALFEQARKPLTLQDQKIGFIYIFWHEGQFGYVKIGRTKDPERRLQQWNKQCQREHKYHPFCDGLEVPYVARVERLMQLELKEKRRFTVCDTCTSKSGKPKKHTEWFELSAGEATAVFQKWKNWTTQGPYQRVAGSGGWKLKPEFEGSLKEVCQPTRFSVAESRPSLRRRSVPSSSRSPRGRHDLRPRPSGSTAI